MPVETDFGPAEAAGRSQTRPVEVETGVWLASAGR